MAREGQGYLCWSARHDDDDDDDDLPLLELFPSRDIRTANEHLLLKYCKTFDSPSKYWFLVSEDPTKYLYNCRLFLINLLNNYKQNFCREISPCKHSIYMLYGKCV